MCGGDGMGGSDATGWDGMGWREDGVWCDVMMCWREVLWSLREV